MSFKKKFLSHITLTNSLSEAAACIFCNREKFPKRKISEAVSGDVS